PDSSHHTKDSDQEGPDRDKGNSNRSTHVYLLLFWCCCRVLYPYFPESKALIFQYLKSISADCHLPFPCRCDILSSYERSIRMLKGFRQSLRRANVMDLAVAVVIGAAFGAVVTSFVNNIITKVIAAAFSKPDFSAFNLTLNGTDIGIGSFLNDLVNFLLVAAAVYFFMVAP